MMFTRLQNLLARISDSAWPEPRNQADLGTAERVAEAVVIMGATIVFFIGAAFVAAVGGGS